ncbi:MnmC family methyltransferase, partial [Arthrospira platensis SPKY1]|nr:MnmC family methyltransferase [Arthrospira platensis SPKY1]
LLALRFVGQANIHYHTIELYPLKWELIQQLNYTELSGLQHYDEAFKAMHCCEWGSNIEVYPGFVFNKRQIDFRDFRAVPDTFDLIFFDAFSPDKQPELWS